MSHVVFAAVAAVAGALNRRIGVEIRRDLAADRVLNGQRGGDQGLGLGPMQIVPGVRRQARAHLRHPHR
jgi:hypothetical protein